MMFIVAFHLPWCRYFAAQEVEEPQLCVDNLKCVSRVLLRAARFTTGFVRLVGQETVPGKCVLLSTSRTVRNDTGGWIATEGGDKWSVKLDVRDLGGHLDTIFRGWSATLATRVWLVSDRLVLIFVLPLDFYGRLLVIKSMFIPGVCMVLRPLSLLMQVCASCPLPYSKLPILVQSFVCSTVRLVV